MIKVRTIVLAAVFLLVAAPAALARSTTVVPNTAVPATVVDVIDGDTLRVDGKVCDNCRVRLLEIDAPEHDQPYGKTARNTLFELVGGVDSTVQLAVEGKDQYGRLLAYVYREGRNINQALVREGAAWVYDAYSDSEVLAELETWARDNKVGLWGLPADQRMPPWEWRHGGDPQPSEVVADLFNRFINGMTEAVKDLAAAVADEMD